MQGTIGEALKASLVKKPAMDNADCIDFSFDIKVMSVEGKFCKQGILDVTVSIIGIKLRSIHVDLSAGEFCNSISVGFEEVQFCFYIKGSCLRTKGYVDGWFHPRQNWDEQIVCF